MGGEGESATCGVRSVTCHLRGTPFGSAQGTDVESEFEFPASRFNDTGGGAGLAGGICECQFDLGALPKAYSARMA